MIVLVCYVEEQQSTKLCTCISRTKGIPGISLELVPIQHEHHVCTELLVDIILTRTN